MKLASPPLLLLTHAAALLGGCMLYSHLRPQTGSTNGGDHQTSAGVTTSAAARTPAQILKDATPALFPLKEANAARLEKNLAATREAIRTLQIPDDIGSAIDAEAADCFSASAGDLFHFSPRFSALLYHWLQTDPEACNQWLAASDRNREAAHSHLAAASLELLKQPDGINTLLSKVPAVTTTTLALWVSTQPDPGLIGRIQSQLNPEQQKSFFRSLGYQWPEDRRQELIDLAVAQKLPDAVANAGAFSGSRHWLADLSKDPAIPADFRQALVKTSLFSSSFCGDSSIPLEERLNHLGSASDGAYDRIASQTLSQLGRDGLPDWAGLIQSGQASPQQMLDAVSRTAPELAAAAPDILRERVFYKLLSTDTAQAASLLDTLPADRRAEVILDSVTKTNSPVVTPPPPDAFAGIMAQLPADDPSLWDRRRDAWKEEITQNFDHSSDENTAAWIEALPPGPDREIALSYGAEKFQTTNPELAARLRSQVTDPRLNQPPGE